MAPVPADPAPLAELAEAWLWSLEPVIQDAFLYCKVAGDQLSVINRKVARHTVSNSGLPRQRAIASQNRTAARSTVSAGNCQASSSMCVATSGVVGGTA